jgi:hypothetical protein
MKYSEVLLLTLLVAIVALVINSRQYGFANPIPGYTIPTPAVPKKPSAATNSNGGLVSIG